MSEKEENRTRIERIYNVVAKGDPEIISVLTEAEVFLRTAANEKEKPRAEQTEKEPPSVLEHPVFQRTFGMLGGRIKHTTILIG